MATESERIRKTFDKYASAMKSRSVKWFFKDESKRADKKIDKFLKYFFIPIKPEEVIALMDTTTFRTGKEGYLFTTSGIVVKEIANKLYYLEFDKMEKAEIVKEVDEDYYVKSSVWIHFKDGTKKQVFDFYIKDYFFVEFINEVLHPRPYETAFDA